MSMSTEDMGTGTPPVGEVQNRKIWPRARIGVFLGIAAVLILAGLNLPPAWILPIWGLLMILRSLWMLVAGSRPGSRWCTDPRVPAASLAPFVVVGVVGTVSYVMAGPMAIGFAILAAIVSASIGFWARHYLIGEMVCSNGVWHDREPWLDPGVSDARKAEWVAQRQSGRKLRA
jgi:hypothetical protein